MAADAQRISDVLLPVLNIPKEGRLLTFGANSAMIALDIAAERDDILVMACDTTYETTREVSDRSLAAGLNNVIIGDSPAGPLVDRALVYQSFATLQDMDLVTIRTAILPGGYAIFADASVAGNDVAARLKQCGYAVADVLDTLGELAIVRAR